MMISNSLLLLEFMAFFKNTAFLYCPLNLTSLSKLNTDYVLKF